MRSKRLLSCWRGLAPLALAAALSFAPATSRGAFITYATPAGSTQNSLPVNASVDITTGAGSVTIVLSNLQANPKSVVQNLSDLLVTFSDDVGPTAITTGAAQELTVASDGTFTPGSTVAPGWVLSSPLSNQIDLNALGVGGVGPAHTLIGPPGGGGTYSNANNSITGNKPHNPFLNQTISWTIAAAGVTANTTVAGVVFSFNTESGYSTTGEVVPEPSTLALLLIGAPVGLLAYRRRRRAG